jgi:hypothetical protein
VFRPTRPTRYQIGEVYGELQFFRTAGAGTVVSPLRLSARAILNYRAPDAPTYDGHSDRDRDALSLLCCI